MALADSTLRFKHFLQPIRDLADSWNIDIARDLEDYLQELEDIRVTFEGGESNLNFAHAALLIQGSTLVYSKKVEYLYALTEEVRDRILERKRDEAARKKRADDGEDEALFKDEQFINLEDMPEGADLDLGEEEEEEMVARNSAARERPSGAFFGLERDPNSGPAADDEIGELKMRGAAVHPSGAVLLQARDRDSLDARLRPIGRRGGGGGGGGGGGARAAAAAAGARGGREEAPPSGAPGEAPPPPPPDDFDDGGNDAAFEEAWDDGPAGGGVEPEPQAAPPQPREDAPRAAAAAAAAAPQRKKQAAEPPKKKQKKEKPSIWEPLDPDAPATPAEQRAFWRPARLGKTWRAPNVRRLCAVEEAPPGWLPFGVDALSRCPPLSVPLESAWARFLAPTAPELLRPYAALARSARGGGGARKAGGANGEDEDEEEGEEVPGEELFGEFGGGGGGGEGAFAPLVEDGPGGPAAPPAEGAGGWDGGDAGFGGGYDAGGDDGSDAGGWEGGPAHESFEDRCRAHVERYLREARGYAEETALAARVAEWQRRLAPALAAEEERGPFDIHETSDGLLAEHARLRGLAAAAPDAACAAAAPLRFGELVAGRPRHAICRAFLALLMLANTGNEVIDVPPPGPRGASGPAPDLPLRLASLRTRHALLESYLAPSLRPAASAAAAAPPLPLRPAPGKPPAAPANDENADPEEAGPSTQAGGNVPLPLPVRAGRKARGKAKSDENAAGADAEPGPSCFTQGALPPPTPKRSPPKKKGRRGPRSPAKGGGTPLAPLAPLPLSFR
eukprot:tig00020610_g12033.t1